MALAVVERSSRFDPQSLEQLLLLCLDSLANLAEVHGQRRQAARLHEAASVLRPKTEPDTGGGLTPREWDVASLVARGCSNRQIAQQLVVSDRTIDTHVSHILQKLELVSRVQIAAWVIEHSRRIKLVG